MHDFTYVRARDPQEAVRALAQPGAAAIAGGTELLNWIRLGVAAPARLVDLAGLNRGVALEAGSLIIGAGATLAEIGDDPLVQRHAAVLAEACLRSASPQVRNRATLGGNVLQKTRCAYFRAEAPLPWACNRRAPGSGCAALAGVNERHAVLGWTNACVATHPSDPAVALACLDAELDILGRAGRRRLAMTELHRLPGDATGADTRLEAGELIVGFRIPVRSGERSTYVKVRERESFEYALVSAAAAVSVTEGRIQVARLALGSVAMKPWRLATAEGALAGRPPTRDAVGPPIRAALTEARPLTHNGHKIELAARAAIRAVLAAGGAA
ncbi:FAD binding domain-containing protein [Phenylobacterium terrae]|uniref:FAD binding domain-containing protein n=1 Tax=Phenylobacterium terrae TaxID=2665495 RepID=A0ABW4N6Y3_9CAUL